MFASKTFSGPWSDAVTAPRLPALTSWALMGDSLACRGGVPEILIEWRRARGEDLPEPQLPELRE